MDKRGAVKKSRVRKFQTSWLDEDIFKGWLAPHPINNKAFCTLCNRTIICIKTHLIQHSQSASHIEKASHKNISQETEQDKESLSHKDKVKHAEIKLAAFFAEHNVPIQTADHLIPLLKNIFTDSKIASDLSLNRHKCKKIITQVIAKRENEETISNLKTCKFSILVDESTDITDTKSMCVLTRYVSPKTNKLMTELLDLIPLNASNCSAEKLFEIFKNLLKEKQIPLQHIIGMASDNASVMIGCNNSFMSRLKLELPDLVVLNCICHSSAIIASKACNKLPQSYENLIRGVASYISGSAKRCAILGEFQEFFNGERNKILKLSNTRWLVLYHCIVRILNNWEVLKNYFVLAVVEDKLKSAEIILQQLNNDAIKAYLLFLKYVLNFFNNFNAFFQSRKILIHKIFESCRQLIIDIGRNFLVPQALEDINNITIDNKIQNINDIYVGPECESFVETLPLECAQEIRRNCLDFYVTSLREMLKRLPYNNIIFEQLMFLQPKVALYHEGRMKITDLTLLATRIGHTNIEKLAFEWKILPSLYNDVQKAQLELLEIDDMWKQIFKFKDISGEKIFPNLELLLHSVLSFPHSNAEAERIFSIVTDVKNKKRNRLANSTVSAICIIRSSFQAKGINCTNFKVDSEHLKLHSWKNIYAVNFNASGSS